MEVNQSKQSNKNNKTQGGKKNPTTIERFIYKIKFGIRVST